MPGTPAARPRGRKPWDVGCRSGGRGERGAVPWLWALVRGSWRPQVSQGRELWCGGSVRGQGQGPDEDVARSQWAGRAGRGGLLPGVQPSQRKPNSFRPPFRAHLTKAGVTGTVLSIFLSEGRRKTPAKQAKRPHGACLVVQDNQDLPGHRLRPPLTATSRDDGKAWERPSVRAERGRFWGPWAPRGPGSPSSSPTLTHRPPHTPEGAWHCRRPVPKAGD